MQRRIQRKRFDSNSIYYFLDTGNVSRKLLNRSFESITSNNIKIKGTLQQIIDKYLSLAREEMGSGSDPVLRESYLQYADYYQRQLERLRVLLNEPGSESDSEPSSQKNDNGGNQKAGSLPNKEAKIHTISNESETDVETNTKNNAHKESKILKKPASTLLSANKKTKQPNHSLKKDNKNIKKS